MQQAKESVVVTGWVMFSKQVCQGVCSHNDSACWQWSVTAPFEEILDFFAEKNVENKQLFLKLMSNRTLSGEGEDFYE